MLSLLIYLNDKTGFIFKKLYNNNRFRLINDVNESNIMLTLYVYQIFDR